MSKKRLNNLLEEKLSQTLADDFDQPAEHWPARPEAALQGWTWTCDDQGHYLTCSPEVEDILGIPPAAFLGQPLTRFALTPASTQVLLVALSANAFPAEVVLEYQSGQGQPIPAAVSLFRDQDDDGAPSGWRGVSILLDPSLAPLEPGENGRVTEILQPQAAPVVAEQPSFELNPQVVESEENARLAIRRQVKEKASLLLEKVRQEAPAIQPFPIQRLLIYEREELKEDRSQPPREVGSFGGRTVLAYPKRFIYRIEQKLEWGTKLDFSDEERSFIERNRTSPPRWKKLLAIRRIPRKILRRDLRWISIVAEIEEGDASRVWVRSRRPNSQTPGVDLETFLKNPDSLLPQLHDAIQHPLKSLIIYRQGRDYFIES